MPRAYLDLWDVRRIDTKDMAAADAIYLVGGVVAGHKTQPILTRPVRINDGQTKMFNGGPVRVFDESVPVGTPLQVVFDARDEEDETKDWNGYASWVKQIQDELDALAKEPSVPWYVKAGKYGSKIATIVAQADKDNHLGNYTNEFPMPPSSNRYFIEVPFKGAPVQWSSDWNYVMRFLYGFDYGSPMTNLRSGLVLSVPGASAAAGERLAQSSDHSEDSQRIRWEVVGGDLRGETVVRLMPLHDLLSLEIAARLR